MGTVNDALQGYNVTPPSNTNRFATQADLAGVGSGTVTSVALTAPVEFSVGGSPVTTSGTLAVSKATQTANTVWAGPTSGSAATPTFRALVTADMPVGTATDVSYFGDGSDGDATIDGSAAAPAWASKSGSNYTLTRDVYADTITFGGTGFITLAGFNLYALVADVQSAIAGAIRWNGNTGNNGTAGPGGGGAASGLANAILGGSGGSAGGGNGGNAAGNAAATPSTVSVGTGQTGGTGGAGGSGASGAGGTGLTPGATTTTCLVATPTHTFLRISTIIQAGAGACGGGGGGGDGTTGAGGGSGGTGGGMGRVMIGEIVTGVSTPGSVVQLKGGTGGNGGSTTAVGNRGGGGGAGGGPGGTLVAGYRKRTGPAVVGFFDVSGGTGGNGGNGTGTGTGGTGGRGGQCGRASVFNIGAGTVTAVTPVAGSLGTGPTGATGGPGGDGASGLVDL